MVATALGIPTEGITVEVEGDLDLRGTLGVARDVPVGFRNLRLRFAIDAPEATADQIAALRVRTEQYCVVLQTLQQPPPVTTTWAAGPPARRMTTR
jgi:uncharacterized OsmC-like protein